MNPSPDTEQITLVSSTVRYGLFNIPLSAATLKACNLTPGQEVTEAEMKDAVYLDRILSADSLKKEVIGR